MGGGGGGAGAEEEVAQWLDRRIRDQKVTGLSVARSGWRIIVFSRVSFLCRLSRSYLRPPPHPPPCYRSNVKNAGHSAIDEGGVRHPALCGFE